jgi:hypothetical protein
MIDDPRDLVRKQPRIDRVIDRADAENAVPRLEVPPRVPGERRHPVAEPDAVAVEPLRRLEGAFANGGVIGGMDRPLDRARNHRAFAVMDRRMVDHPVAQERPVLHQSAHVFSPCVCYRWPALGRSVGPVTGYGQGVFPRMVRHLFGRVGGESLTSIL